MKIDYFLFLYNMNQSNLVFNVDELSALESETVCTKKGEKAEILVLTKFKPYFPDLKRISHENVNGFIR